MPNQTVVAEVVAVSKYGKRLMLLLKLGKRMTFFVGLKFLMINFFFVIPGARHSACTIPTWPLLGGRGPLEHLCNLEAGYEGGGMVSKLFGWAAPGFKPRTSCLRVRSVYHYATGEFFIYLF